eukprot:scpid91619/ scgid11809/ PiggyBac transposable element-derived protein 4
MVKPLSFNGRIAKWLQCYPRITKATDHVMKQRHAKVTGQHVHVDIKTPQVVNEYNQGMGVVDVFDQRCTPYRVSRKSRKFWKAIFFDYLEISCVNSMVLFESYRSEHPEIQRNVTYDHEEFRVQ